MNLSHLRLLVIKNIRLQIRSPLWLLLEITLPVILILYSILLSPKIVTTAVNEINLLERNNYTILWNMEEKCCDAGEVEDWMAFLANTSALQVKKLEADEDMKQGLAQRLLNKAPLNLTTTVGLEIQAMDPGNKMLKYKLLVGKVHLAATKIDRWGPHLEFYGQDDATEIYNIQYRIEDGFQQVRDVTQYAH